MVEQDSILVKSPQFERVVADVYKGCVIIDPVGRLEPKGSRGEIFHSTATTTGGHINHSIRFIKLSGKDRVGTLVKMHMAAEYDVDLVLLVKWSQRTQARIAKFDRLPAKVSP